MGFFNNVGNFIRRATKLPKEVRQINLGKSIRESAIGAVERFEMGVRRGLGGAAEGAAGTIEDVRGGAQAAKMLPWIIGAIGVVVAIALFRRRR